MSELVKAIILGLVQGLSEFLPISSSGHLVLAAELLGFKQPGVAFEVFVHFGTLLAVVLVFRKDIWQMIRWLPAVPGFIRGGMRVKKEADEYKAMSLYIVLGSIPAAVLGILFKDYIEQSFDNTVLVLAALMFTGVIMWSSRYTKESYPFLNAFQAFLIGCAQAFAIIPGISRSGSTIVTALWLGIQRDNAARFSFLLSAPVIFGASLLKFFDLMEAPPSADEMINLIAGTIAAAISGYFAIVWMLEIIRKQKLEWFGVYCLLVGLVGFFLITLGN